MSLGCARPPVSRANEIASAERLMTPEDLEALPSRAPDQRIAYGSESSQYGELRIPAGMGPHPVVVLIHGGCFKASYATARYFGAMADALKSEGIATWNIEYRRLGEAGSGWPGTYLDIGRGVETPATIDGPPPGVRPQLAADHQRLDLEVSAAVCPRTARYIANSHHGWPRWKRPRSCTASTTSTRWEAACRSSCKCRSSWVYITRCRRASTSAWRSSCG